MCRAEILWLDDEALKQTMIEASDELTFDVALDAIRGRLDRRVLQELALDVATGALGGPRSRGWAWAPLAVIGEHHSLAWSRLHEAALAGSDDARRALALANGAPVSMRRVAVDGLGTLICDVLAEGDEALADWVAARSDASAVLAGLVSGNVQHIPEARERLGRALQSRLGTPALLASMGEHERWVVAGDLWEVLDDALRAQVERYWSNRRIHPYGSIPHAVPSVRDAVVEGARQGEYYWVRKARVLGAALHEVPSMTARLRELVGSGEWAVPEEAIQCLMERSNPDAEDMRLFVESLQHDDADVRKAALEALRRHGNGPDVMSAVRERLADSEGGVRHRSAALLAERGELSAEELLYWVGCHSEADSRTPNEPWASEGRRRRIGAALAPHLGRSPALRTEVEALLESPRWSVRQGAAFTLAYDVSGPSPLEALLFQAGNVRDADFNSHKVTCAAALLFVPSSRVFEAAMGVLCRGLALPDDPVLDQADVGWARVRCAEALGSLDLLTRGDEVVAALRKACVDSASEVRSAAWEALRRVLTAPPSLDLP